MDNISRIADISGGLRDTSGRHEEKGKKKERGKSEEVKTFADIYDVRRQSAMANRDSSAFHAQLLKAAGEDLNKVITGLDALKAEQVTGNLPAAEEIIALTKALKRP